MPSMADIDDSSGGAEGVIKLALKDFLECFPPPQSGRIVDGYEPDFNTHEAFNLPTGSILNFHRQVSPNVPLSFRDSWGGSRHNTVKVTLPIEFQGKFRPLPFDPASGDQTIDHIYRTVDDLVRAFPVYVQVNSSYQPPEEAEISGVGVIASLACGDRLKLIRLVHKYGHKLLECRRLGETRLLLLPMDCAGHFTALPDHNDYLLSDLMSMLPRRRRLALSDITRTTHKIPGLPANFTGDLILEEPEAFVEASPMDDPGLIIGLPSNLNITVSPEDNSYDRGQLLNTFATNNRTLFPVVARMTDWDEETTILENHYVKPGIELVIHGWTRQSKVLAQTESGRQFAIPLTYQGQFRILPTRFNGVSELEHAHPAYKVRVLSKDDADTANIVEGDTLRVRRGDTSKRAALGEVTFIKCEKLDPNNKVKEIIRLPLSCNARFEEVLEDDKTMNFWIRDLVSFVTDAEVGVEAVSNSTDQKNPERDLPVKTRLTLCDFIIEPAVYVSVETAEAPAFHIPLRTLVYLTFVQQLEKSSSPLLTKQNPRLSTLDRCVEILPLDVFNALQPRSRDETSELTISALSAMQQQLNNTRPPPSAWSVAGGETNRGYDDYGGFGGPVMPHVGMRPQSFNTSDKSRSFTARLKDKFKRHKSTENLHKASQQDFAPMSLPKQAPHHRSQELPLTQNGLSVHNGHNVQQQNGHNGDTMSLSSQGNLTYISRSSSMPRERWIVEIPIEISRSNSLMETAGQIENPPKAPPNVKQRAPEAPGRKAASEASQLLEDNRQAPERPSSSLQVPSSASQGARSSQMEVANKASHIKSNAAPGKDGSDSTQGKGPDVPDGKSLAVSRQENGSAAPRGKGAGAPREKKRKAVPQTNGFHNGESSPEPLLNSNNQVNGTRSMTPMSIGGHSPENLSYPSNQFMQPMMQPQIYGQPTQSGAGYMLMPMAQPAPQAVSAGYMMVPTMPPAPAAPAAVPPGYMLVPMMPGMQQTMPPQQQPLQPQLSLPNNEHLPPSASSSEDDTDSIAYSEFSSRSRSQQVKMAIPQDGNLYSFSIKKMAEFLRQMRMTEETVRACVRDKVDGRKFSKLNEADLERYGLMNPVILHFRRSTYKRRPNFML